MPVVRNKQKTKKMPRLKALTESYYKRVALIQSFTDILIVSRTLPQVLIGLLNKQVKKSQTISSCSANWISGIPLPLGIIN